jgi:hypothetical protein
MKEKAYELFMFYYTTIPYTHTNKQRAEIAKKCAIKLVDEILSVIWIYLDDEVDYWAKVKQEIEAI